MAAFRCAVWDLEQMLGTVLCTAVMSAPSLARKLDVIQEFAQLGARDILRQDVT